MQKPTPRPLRLHFRCVQRRLHQPPTATTRRPAAAALVPRLCPCLQARCAAAGSSSAPHRSTKGACRSSTEPGEDQAKGRRATTTSPSHPPQYPSPATPGTFARLITIFRGASLDTRDSPLRRSRPSQETTSRSSRSGWTVNRTINGGSTTLFTFSWVNRIWAPGYDATAEPRHHAITDTTSNPDTATTRVQPHTPVSTTPRRFVIEQYGGSGWKASTNPAPPRTSSGSATSPTALDLAGLHLDRLARWFGEVNDASSGLKGLHADGKRNLWHQSGAASSKGGVRDQHLDPSQHAASPFTGETDPSNYTGTPPRPAGSAARPLRLGAAGHDDHAASNLQGEDEAPPGDPGLRLHVHGHQLPVQRDGGTASAPLTPDLQKAALSSYLRGRAIDSFGQVGARPPTASRSRRRTLPPPLSPSRAHTRDDRGAHRPAGEDINAIAVLRRDR